MIRAWITTTATAALLAGCGDLAQQPPATQPAKVAEANRSHEYTSGPPPAEHAQGPASTATQAVTEFASAYINWTPATVTADMLALARRSIGQARSAMEIAAAGTAQDYELQRGGISNSGTVEAVAPLMGSANRYIVVTREQTTATNAAAYQGLRPAWHLALATVTRQPSGGWVVSGWQPEI